jgi:hypothetical protein
MCSRRLLTRTSDAKDPLAHAVSPTPSIDGPPSAAQGEVCRDSFDEVSPSSGVFGQQKHPVVPNLFSQRLRLHQLENVPSVEDTLVSTSLRDTTDTLSFLVKC